MRKTGKKCICNICMDDTSDQDNELEIISETVKPQSNYDDVSKLLNQAVERKLMQQYPRLELAGKKIRICNICNICSLYSKFDFFLAYL